jgi:hypothetical protein
MVLHIPAIGSAVSRSECSFNFCSRRPTAKAVSLNKAVGGFYRRGCKRSVECIFPPGERATSNGMR